MQTNQMFEMFFNCLVKSKYNLMSFGKFNMSKTLELVGILDHSILQAYKLASAEGLELEFELGKIEEYTDYPYNKKQDLDSEEYRMAVLKLVDHLLSHVKELRIGLEDDGEFFMADLVASIGTKLYNFKLEF